MLQRQRLLSFSADVRQGIENRFIGHRVADLAPIYEPPRPCIHSQWYADEIQGEREGKYMSNTVHMRFTCICQIAAGARRAADMKVAMSIGGGRVDARKVRNYSL